MQEVTMMPTSCTTISMSWDLAPEWWAPGRRRQRAATRVTPLTVLQTSATASAPSPSPENSATKARSAAPVSAPSTLMKHQVPGCW